MPSGSEECAREVERQLSGSERSEVGGRADGRPMGLVASFVCELNERVACGVLPRRVLRRERRVDRGFNVRGKVRRGARGRKERKARLQVALIPLETGGPKTVQGGSLFWARLFLV